MFRLFKGPSSGHSLENNLIKYKTHETLAYYGIPCSFTKLFINKTHNTVYGCKIMEVYSYIRIIYSKILKLKNKCVASLHLYVCN
jgi:hypothetical protein